MNKITKITLIKITHTIIWFLLVAAIFYVFYSGISGSTTRLTYISIYAVFAEMIIYALNKFTCPLHTIAQNQSGDKNINDSYLPRWFFGKSHNIFFTFVFFMGLFLVLIKR